MSMKAIAASLAISAGVAAAASLIGLSGRAAAHGEHNAHAFAAGEPGDPKKAFRVIEMLMTDGPGTMAYTPARLEIKKGEQIKFVLKNVGMVDHEFLIDSFANNAKHKKEMEKTPEMAHHEPNGTRLSPNTTAEILWRFTKTGAFEFACLIPGHYETGMKGTLVVR